MDGGGGDLREDQTHPAVREDRALLVHPRTSEEEPRSYFYLTVLFAKRNRVVAVTCPMRATRVNAFVEE